MAVLLFGNERRFQNARLGNGKRLSFDRKLLLIAVVVLRELNLSVMAGSGTEQYYDRNWLPMVDFYSRARSEAGAQVF